MRDSDQKVLETLEERRNIYGNIEDVGKISEQLFQVVVNHKNFENLSYAHIEAIKMIFSKIARMVNGDPMHLDNAVDIQGYARLLAMYIERNAPKN